MCLSRQLHLIASAMPLHIATLLFALHFLLTTCTAYHCRRVPGALVQIDAGVGQVFGVNHYDNIYALYGSSWKQLPGKLKHVTVGPSGVWGASRSQHVYKLVAANWVNVPGLVNQIDAGGDQFISGSNRLDTPFCLPMESTVGYRGPNSAVNWFDFTGMSLKYYSCGPYSCWGVNRNGNIFIRKWVDSTRCQGVGDWQRIPGSLSMIEVGGDGSVYGVDSRGYVFRRDLTSAFKPEGSGWSNIPVYRGQVRHVSYDVGHLWLILKNKAIYDCTV